MISIANTHVHKATLLIDKITVLFTDST